MAGDTAWVVEDGREAGPHRVVEGDGNTFDLVPAPELRRADCDYRLEIGESKHV